MKIVITGSIAYDYLMTYPRTFREMLLREDLDHLSVSFLVDHMSRHRGGVGPNIAYTLALLGEHPLLVGTAGQDFDEYGAFLEQAGVDTGGIRIHRDLFTASFFATTDRENNQIASFYTGAMIRARDLSLRDVLEGRADLVVISPNDPVAMRNYVAECKALGIPYLYDPSQQVARVGGEELAEGVDGAHILVVNEYEYAALKKKTGYSDEDLLERAGTVIVTRGEQGTDIYTEGWVIHIPIVPPREIKDPTGVGDAFRGGLLKGLAAGWPWEISGRVGALAATYVLEQIGTQNHYYTRREFVERFRQHFDDGGLLDEMLSD
ncbi:MAG TPA: carbohydrate kinase family protein [Chloroflexi bacterium]|nr:carbohydrate kinase family protein [Chloroflexota bacterium]